MADPKPVGVGLVGAGAFGAFCLEAFAAMPEVNIAAIADTATERATDLATLYGANAYDSLDALLNDPAVEIVALNTPPYLHAEQGLAALRAGKRLFCEKPLALTVADGEALVYSAGVGKGRLTVDYVMRRNPYWRAAADLRRVGVLGALRHMDLANHAAGLNLPNNHWFWDAGKSGGIWIEHGVHFFDAFAWVAGGEGSIRASAAFRRGDGVTDRVEALARYGDTAAHFYHAFDQSSLTEQTTVILTFERGYVTLREWVPTSLEIITTVDEDMLRPYLPGKVETHTRHDGRTFAYAYAPEGKSNVYRACIQDGLRDLALAAREPEHALLVTGREGVESLRMAVAATQMA
jgi:predicted dehydrogenase